MKYRLTHATTWLDLPSGIGLLTPLDAVQLDEEDAPSLRQLLELLRTPRTRQELTDVVDEASVDELLETFEELGLIEPVAHDLALKEPRVRAALERGCVIVTGNGAAADDLAAAVTSALSPWRISADRAMDRDRAFESGALVIGCFASLFDAAVIEVNERALASGAAYLPVVVDRGQALIGPVTGADAPCSRCVSLRVMARGGSPIHHVAWYETKENGAAVHGGLDTRRAPLVAQHVLSYLEGLDVGGALEGKPHPLLRVRLQGGVADVRRVLRHSHCRACGPRPPSLKNPTYGVLERQRDEVEAHWSRVLEDDPESMRPEPAVEQMYRDPLTGLLDHGEDWEHRKHYFRNLPECWGGLSLVREQEWVTTDKQGINGTGPDLEHLRLVMLSEGLERYGQYSHRAAVEGLPYQDLTQHAFDPRELTLYGEEQYEEPQFPRPRFREDLPLNWTWGYGLKSGRARLFPQEVITVALTDEVYPNRILEQRLTTGGASHVSYARALHNAMRELIERDQLMIAWYKRVALPRVPIPDQTGNDYVDGLLSFLREGGVQLDLFDMRLDLPVPSFLLLGTVKDRQGCLLPGGTVGAAAADLDPITALGRALGEMRIHYETLAHTPDDNKDYRKNPYDPHDMTQGWRLWWPNYMWHLNPENRRAFDFLYSSQLKGRFEDIESLETGDPKKNRDRLLSCFTDVGLEPFAWDLGNEETSHSGFRIVKLEVPGICHLVPGRQSRRLACARFEDVPRRLGRACLPPGEENPDPHVQA